MALASYPLNYIWRSLAGLDQIGTVAMPAIGHFFINYIAGIENTGNAWGVKNDTVAQNARTRLLD